MTIRVDHFPVTRAAWRRLRAAWWDYREAHNPTTLANCSSAELMKLKAHQHFARTRGEMIYAAGALNNHRLRRELGSMELSTFYDGMVAAGHLDQNPYWPDRV